MESMTGRSAPHDRVYIRDRPVHPERLGRRLIVNCKLQIVASWRRFAIYNLQFAITNRQRSARLRQAPRYRRPDAQAPRYYLSAPPAHLRQQATEGAAFSLAA